MVQSLDDAHRRQRNTTRVPPHNLEAERSLLGAMLLSRDAIASAVEACRADDFYKPAHAHVFDAVTTLYSQGEPADPLTVADVLARAGLLESVGGLPALSALQADTPATTNASRYARIVEEHALLRKLIGVAGEIAELGYSVPDDVADAVDHAESLVFNIAERRVTDTLKPLKDLLEESLDRLATLFNRSESITGVPTGFHDLDERLSGLQPSALVIVGARPAMGKALDLDTPIPTPGGWSTMGTLRVGDRVLDEAGRPCTVTYRSPVHRDRRCYRVTFDDGSSLVADAEHQWLAYGADRPGGAALVAAAAGVGERGAAVGPRAAVGPAAAGTAGTGGGRVVTTEEMVAAGVAVAGRPRWRVPVSAALDLPAVDLPVDPYRLGRRLAALAAGGRAAAAPPSGASPQAGAAPPSGGPGSAAGAVVPGPPCIPAAYLRASSGQRSALLRGLMDRAGVLDVGGWVECQLGDVTLASQVRELVCSLGHRAGPVLRTGVTGADGVTRPAWRVRWRPGGLAADTPGGATHAIRSIRRVPTVPVRCITVDSPSHLYLAGPSMIPTHNTAFSLGIAAHASMVARVPTLVFSLEMSHAEITQRLLVSEARVDSSRVRNGRLQDADWPKISNAIGRLGEAPLYIDDNPNLTVMEVRAKARRLKSKEGGLGLVIIDYLQLMSGRSSAESRQVEVSEISRGLKILARELDVPVVALSQLSRNLEARADKRPVLADLRESGSLEQDADVVMFLYRDEMYNPDSADRGTAEVIVAKHRNGPTGTTNLAFLDHHTRFSDMARI